MLRSIQLSGIACALGLVLSVSRPAVAQTYTATYTGFLASGSTDTAGLFGGGNLSNDAFTATYVFSFSAGANHTYISGYSDDLHGGSAYGAASPFTAVSITINGHTQSFLYDYADFIFVCNTPWCGNNNVNAVSGDALGNVLSIPFEDPNWSVVPNLAAAQSDYTLYNVDTNYAGAIILGSDDLTIFATAVYLNEPVPEPASLALLAGGLTVLGVVRRHRNRACRDANGAAPVL